jgi:hypothetical protein
MTGGDSNNPYWDIVAPAVDGNVVGEESVRLFYARDLLQAAYAYPIPSPGTLHWAAAETQGRPLVEIGAGRGYWAHQLTRLGVDVAAYDSNPPANSDNNPCFPPIDRLPRDWHPVRHMRDLNAQHNNMSAAVLFLCWPPAWGDPMASNALTNYAQAGGDRLIYVGEPRGGTSADDRFFDALNADWELASEHPAHVRWWGLNDIAQCWKRRQ